jgi:hypothetical protein
VEDMDLILHDLEKQDVHRTLRYGISEEVAKQMEGLCAIYRTAQPEDKAAMRSKMTGKTSWMFLAFSGRSATIAMQQRDVRAIDLGLVAFDLSNVMRVGDLRDTFGPIAQLAYAARECGVSIVDRAVLIIPDISPQLMLGLEHPRTPRVTRGDDGKLVFRNPWSTS